jgi:hypothetical protein
MAESDKTVRIPLFDGKKKNFVMWWTRFKAYAKVQKFAQALGETPEAALPADQDDLDALDRADPANLPAPPPHTMTKPWPTWQWHSLQPRQ